MDENKNSDIKKISISVKNSNPWVALPNFRSGISNSNSKAASSNNLWLDRNHNLPNKRSRPENDDWGKDCKSIKRITPVWEKNERKSEVDGNDKSNENSYDNPVNLQELALASKRLADAIKSQHLMALAMSQQSHQHCRHPLVYDYNGTENSTIDPNRGAFGLNPSSQVMSINSQWPVSHVLPVVASSVASTSGIGMSNGMEMVSPTNGNIPAYPYMNMFNNDPSLYPMVPSLPCQLPYAPFTVVPDVIVPIFNNLEPIVINHAVLTPPPPEETRNHRQKPPGCRTVFVGNLPENISENIIREAFKICGAITMVRMSKKFFCHIRFQRMESVDQALLLSGFRIRIDESDKPAFNGRLKVDYANARDDQHDYECFKRARLREERHRQREALRPPSPPPIPHFSEHEASTLVERLNNKDTFREALKVLITWLDRGECGKRNSGTFYSLIQSSHGHVRRLRIEKGRYKEEVEKAHEKFMNKNRSIESEVNDIEKVFVAAGTQKVWDHFTKSQRKKMEEMKNDTRALKEANSEDLVFKREEVEMEMSDSEDKNDNEERDMLLQNTIEELKASNERTENLAEQLRDAKLIIEKLEITIAQQQKSVIYQEQK